MQQLRACQKEALEKFEEYFYKNSDENDRGIISMCCGSGKTRTSYEIIKSCIKKKEKFFILATSRVKLIYQLANDYIKWSKLDKIGLNIKVVGGSGEEHKNITLSNIDDIKNSIKGHVCHDKRPLLLITTYNSCNKIVNAVKGNKELHPNLTILDEAHNTTGDNAKMNHNLIAKSTDDDEDFSSGKYLFMTATPVKLILKDKNSSFQNNETLYSMGNKRIYGDVVYEYTFYRGFNDNPPVLVPFDTIYYVKKDEIPVDLKKALENKTKTEKQYMYFKTISSFLIKNIKKYKLKHVLVYLQNQEKIEIMNKEIKKITDEQKIKYNINSIHSNQSKKIRADNLEKFRDKKNESNILLSVGIFDEGVDEPCIDAVMFAEERNTQTRIVQNIGRCLRIDPNNQHKKKGYVLIPNIVYEFNDEDTDNEIDVKKNYSSHFKTIRKIASVLHEDNKEYFYIKYVKGDMPDESDEEENDKNELCDDYYKADIKTKNENMTDIDTDNIPDLSKYFKSECTNGDISNESLQNIKELIKKYEINSLNKYGEFARKSKIPYIYLHEEFKTEWISWGHFLQEKSYTYTEAKEFISKKFKNKFKEPKEWIDYYCSIINNELNNKENNEITDELLIEIIKIPNRPKEYYKGDWIDWADFLSLENDATKQIGLIKTIADEQSKADKNIKVLMNNDHERIKRLIKGDYNDISLKSDLVEIKKYIDTQLDLDCILQPRVFLKNNGNFDKCCIQCRPKDNDKYTIPIIIYPEENKFKYDLENLYVNKLPENIKMNRTKEIFVQNPKILTQFDAIIKECRQIINENKKNEEIINNTVDQKDVNDSVAINQNENDDIDELFQEFKKDNQKIKLENKTDEQKNSKNKILVKGNKKSEKKMIEDTYL